MKLTYEESYEKLEEILINLNQKILAWMNP